MFDSTDRQFNGKRQAAARELDRLELELRKLGLSPSPRHGSGRTTVAGVALRVSVQRVLEDHDEGQAFLRGLGDCLGEGIPVNVSAEDFCGGASVIDAWQRFCEFIQTALVKRHLSGRDLGLSIYSHQMPLEAYRLIADAVLGCGQRYVYLDSLQMAAHDNPVVARRAAANWSSLFRQRGMEHPLMPVYGGIVRSACPLLADEVAATVSPGSGLHGPVNSAWLSVTLPLTNFATAAGKINWQRLGSAIPDALAVADQMHSLACWESLRQASDARENRRLAFSITGLGDLVARRGDKPTSLDCLKWLTESVDRIRCVLNDHSRQLAVNHGAVPALQEANHVSQWSVGPQRDSWHRHWHEAMTRSALRHRNLLAISPYAVIPTGASPDPAYCDLLPVIALADAWTFANPPEFGGWNVAQYRRFHCRARATIHGSRSGSFIAARV